MTECVHAHRFGSPCLRHVLPASQPRQCAPSMLPSAAPSTRAACQCQRLRERGSVLSVVTVSHGHTHFATSVRDAHQTTSPCTRRTHTRTHARSRTDACIHARRGAHARARVRLLQHQLPPPQPHRCSVGSHNRNHTHSHHEIVTVGCYHCHTDHRADVNHDYGVAVVGGGARDGVGVGEKDAVLVLVVHVHH